MRKDPWTLGHEVNFQTARHREGSLSLIELLQTGAECRATPSFDQFVTFKGLLPEVLLDLGESPGKIPGVVDV